MKCCRFLDSIQLTTAHKVSTPVNWKPGEDVIISGAVSDEDAKKQYPGGFTTVKPYLRIVPVQILRSDHRAKPRFVRPQQERN